VCAAGSSGEEEEPEGLGLGEERGAGLTGTPPLAFCIPAAISTAVTAGSGEADDAADA